MYKSVAAAGGFIRSVATLGFVGLLSFGSYVGYKTYYARDLAEQELAATKREVEELTAEVSRKQAKIDELETAVRLLKVDHRVAHVVVLDQRPGAPGQRMSTRFSFVEVDEAGVKLESPKEFTIQGDTLYIDSWVVKFTDEHIEQADPLRSTSVCLFRRLFGEFQKPEDGFELDPIGARPAAYSRGTEMSTFERELWTNFWEYANNPAKAKAAGLRAVHGEAPFTRLQPGKLYKVLLRASGGLSIEPEELPGGVLPAA